MKNTMSDKIEARFGKLGITGATVHFVYSFCLVELDAESKLHRYLLNPDVLIALSEQLKKNPAILLPSEKQSGQHMCIARFENPGRGTPSDRKGISPHLDFITDTYDSVYISFKHVEHINEGNDGQEVPYPRLKGSDGPPLSVSIAGLVRLMPNSSTCCLSVSLITSKETTQGEDGYQETQRENSPNFSSDEVHKLLQLIKTKGQDSPFQSKIQFSKHNSITLFELFRRVVNKICEYNDFGFEDKASQLTWLEAYGKNPMISPCSESQTPVTITVLEVDDETAETFCQSGCRGREPAQQKMLGIQEYEDEIAPILFRSPTEHNSQGLMLEPSYLRTPTPQGVPGLFNMGVDARLYVHVSRRSALCIFRDMATPPADHFLNDLLNLVEIVRARWHMLIIMNQVVDHAIRDFRSGVEDEDYESDKLRELVRLREWLSTSLEDPGIYVVAGEFLSNLSGHLEKTFRIDKLRKLVLGKFKLLEKLYRDVTEIQLLDIERPLRRLRKMRKNGSPE